MAYNILLSTLSFTPVGKMNSSYGSLVKLENMKNKDRRKYYNDHELKKDPRIISEYKFGDNPCVYGIQTNEPGIKNMSNYKKKEIDNFFIKYLCRLKGGYADLLGIRLRMGDIIDKTDLSILISKGLEYKEASLRLCSDYSNKKSIVSEII